VAFGAGKRKHIGFVFCRNRVYECKNYLKQLIAINQGFL